MQVDYNDDIVFAKFINYMKKALYTRRIKYLFKQSRVLENETYLNDNFEYGIEIIKDKTIEYNFLNMKEKRALELHFIKGFTYKEIAKIENESVETIKSRIKRATKKLRSKLGGNYEI